MRNQTAIAQGKCQVWKNEQWNENIKNRRNSSRGVGNLLFASIIEQKIVTLIQYK